MLLLASKSCWCCIWSTWLYQDIHLFLWWNVNSFLCDTIPHLFLCDGITICLSVTTVIYISVTMSTFFFVTAIFYFSVTAFAYLSATEHPLCVCDRTSIYLSVRESPSVFLWYNIHLLLQTKEFCVSQNHVFSESDFNSSCNMCVAWGSNSHIFSP
jgi:hypothetical protein